MDKSKLLFYGLIAVVVILLVIVGWMVWVQYFSGTRALSPQERISEQTVSTEAIEQKLSTAMVENKELKDYIKQQKLEIDKLVTINLQYEERVGEGAGKTSKEGNFYKVGWSEEWSDGETTTDGITSHYSIAYHIPPIDLTLVQSGKIWIASTDTEGVRINNIYVTEQPKTFWEKFNFTLGAGISNPYEPDQNHKLAPVVFAGLSYNKVGLQFATSSNFYSLSVYKQW